MRRHWTWMLVTALAALLVAGLLAPAAPAAERAARAPKAFEQSDPVSYIIKTRDANIYAEAIHPTKGGKIVKSPTILTYSPYSILGRNGDAGSWVPQGYTRMYVDVIGTGNSGGCWDYGGDLEKRTVYDVIEWIAKQKWSTGKVAMIGGSYEGTTATAAAVTHAPHLTTIVPEAAISRWYGYAFAGGIRFNDNNEYLGPQGPGAVSDEGIDTPFAFDFGLALPPPVDPQDPEWGDRVSSTITPCDEIEHTQYGYDDTPDYDKFWKERDYLKDAGSIKIPVLVSHNWGDWNVKQQEGWNLFHALTHAKQRVMFFGTRWEGHGVPSVSEYDKFVHAWMDHYLMGKDNGIDKAPEILSVTSDYEGAGKLYAADKVKTTPVALTAMEMPITTDGGYPWMLMPHKPQLGMVPTQAFFNSANINTESHAAHHGRNNHDWQWFESPAFKKDTRLFGSIKVQLRITTDREWVTLTPSIVDIKPECHSVVANQHMANPECSPRAVVAMTRGWLDTRYRNGLAKQELLKPMKPFDVTVVENPQDYVFKKGHSLGLLVQTEINEWSLPKPYPCSSPDCVRVRINWEEGKTRVILPVVGSIADPAGLFETLGHHH